MSDAPPLHATLPGTLLPWLLVSAGLTLLTLWLQPNISPGVAWVAAVTVVTFALFGWDKLAAGRERRRIPEAALLIFCLLGGSLGALVGMNLFQHKTAKSSFRVRYWGVVVLQLVGFVAWVYLRRGGKI